MYAITTKTELTPLSALFITRQEQAPALQNPQTVNSHHYLIPIPSTAASSGGIVTFPQKSRLSLMQFQLAKTEKP